MSKAQETLADIVAQIRAAAYIQNADTPKSVLRLADRIEAAAKRECIEAAIRAATQGVKLTNEKYANMPIGDAAAMREALENSNGLLEELAAIGEWGESAREQIAENNAALVKPPRNCDVGTAAEQERRFVRYCNSRVCKRRVCASCGYEELFRHKCFAIWAQMPCEEGGAK